MKPTDEQSYGLKLIAYLAALRPEPVAVKAREIGEAIISASNVADETLAIDGNHLVLTAPEGFVRLDLKKIAAALVAHPVESRAEAER